jgi:hypothetical protein
VKPSNSVKVIDAPKTARQRLAAYLYSRGWYNLSELVCRDMYANMLIEAIIKNMVPRERPDGTCVDDSLLASLDACVIVKNATPKIPTSKRVRAKKSK